MLLSGVKRTLGEKMMDKITSCKILLVGAGGIGCELLKNLALAGFTHVEVIDLDTIDVSNLNRQFLFRRHHVGMPKCTVACQAALDMLPSDKKEAKYIAHHGNVCDNSKFNVQYVSSFDLVLNALDNVAARRRVNRLCLAASVPLVEAGTTGYLGQVTVIDKPSEVECYECSNKPTQKVYPICTIRSTPSQPVHTIVWAKELYKLFFNPKVEDSMLFEDQTGDETSTYMDIVMKLRSELVLVSTDSSSGENDMDQAKIRAMVGDALVALYNTEIQKQLDMDRFKTAQKVPTSVSVDMIQKVAGDMESVAPSKQPQYKQTQIMSKNDCVAEAISCIMDAVSLARSGATFLPEFDKDDALAMRLITCTSNLRAYVFGIEPLQSHYSAKGIAGNIIPAIATTNAIVAGLQILQAFHILQKQIESKKGDLKGVCRYTYCLRDKTRKGFYLQPTTLPDPNPKCFVCRNAVIDLTLNTSNWTLEMLLRRIIKKELGFMEPSLNIGSSIIYEEGEDIGDDEYAAMVVKKLVDLPAGGVQHGTIVKIEDFTQDLEVDVCIYHKSEWEVKEGEDEQVDEEEQFTIGGDKPAAAAAVQSKDENDSAKENGASNADDDDDEIEVVVDGDGDGDDESGIPSNGNGHSKKRALGEDDIVVVEGETKKTRLLVQD
jgi:ubiquitin-like 1-activating enzyme E1 B